MEERIRANVSNAASSSAFAVRACPACGETLRDALFALKAWEFAELNWTYVGDYAARLGISRDAEFPVDQCRACGFVYARYLPNSEFLDVVYDQVIDTRLAALASATAFDGARRMRYVARLAELALPTTVAGESVSSYAALDFGSGFGRTARLLAELGCNVVAYDPSPSRRELGGGPEARVFVASSLAEVNAHGPYRIVVIDNVLEHLPDPRRTLQEIVRACEFGVAVFVSVPSYERGTINRLLCDHRAGRLADMTLNPWEHLNYFDVRQLDRMMAHVGLFPVHSAEQPAPVEIGLRPERYAARRIANGAASALRLARYLLTGSVMETVEQRYYRRSVATISEATGRQATQ